MIMKKIAMMIMATFALAAAVPAFAAEMTKEEKDQCLLASKNCATEVDSIQKKIKKLNAEIKKGKKVYSADEIKKLQGKLKEAEDMLDVLLGLKGGAQ